MSEEDIAGATALVTGASRGLGRGIATALSKAGAQVVGVAGLVTSLLNEAQERRLGPETVRRR